MELLLTIIGSAAFGWIFSDQITIWNEFKEKIGLGVERKIVSKNKIINYILKLLHHFLNCVCISFWITLIITGNLFAGFISYALAAFFAHHMNKITFY